MKMEIRSIIRKLPRGTEIYVFGSCLWRKDPKDVDVLIVYDPDVCQPERAHESVADAINALKKALGRPVHLTLLTRQEEEGCAFKIDTGCVSLEAAVAANPSLRGTRDKAARP
jgi:predicted nucleotidyltransferase